jgi:DNA repair protein RecN (Recombination protein N)
MLLNIHIKNLALIDDVSVSFTDKLNILTGETGAGKSIIIGALRLGMGERFARNMLRNPELEGLCQLLFVVDDKETAEELKAAGVTLSEDGELIITRRMLGNRVINTINDEAVTAAKLKEISALLIDLHAQHDQQSLLKKAEHLYILDKFGRKVISPYKEELKNEYKNYISIRKELEELDMDEEEKNRKLDFLKYEISEIEAAALKTGEDEEIEALYKKIRNSRDIIAAASGIYDITGYESGASAGNQIGRALNMMKGIHDLDGELDNIYENLINLDAVLNDFNVELKAYMESMDFDDEMFSETENRLNVINDMKGKYGRTIADIYEYLEKEKAEYARLLEYDSCISRLRENLKLAKDRMLQAAKKLSDKRKQVAEELCKNIREALKDLSFLDARFDMVFETLPECTANGIDDAYFIISTNPGEKPRPLYDVASGGELSRIMLAIKSCMAGEDNIDTLIFDEIDVGISGRAAQKVAVKLMNIAKSHQVISITHLPQIAAMADSHYLIEKNVEKARTVTHISKLDKEGQLEEIARLLGGELITENVRKNAQEMKELADKAKIINN